ncbi:PREDICTED: uncharacterized protein LOC106102749 [Papilio polytes]|uniref:uncharacterized protein LOC106102749 n=1 Tax=Papilio polytes TaxID=76194 RepID=UPI000675FE8E|nr:PREDICTED: uncharacterized protein LOC106102749 [Papilio polytes]
MAANTEKKEAKGTQMKGKLKFEKKPCPWLCDMVPVNVPPPGQAQAVLHPRKDVFVLKVAKIGANGDRRCKLELELVTPKGPQKKAPCRIETRETQCEPECEPCGCMKTTKRKK